MLLFLLMAFTQTSTFRRIVKEQLIQIANNQLHGELNIEVLEGNLFNRLSLHQLTFTSSDSLILSLTDLTLEYDLKTILNNQITIDSIHLIHPLINLWQEKDSTWNIQHLIAKRTDTIVTTQKNSRLSS